MAADGITPLPFQEGDKVKFKEWDRERDLTPHVGWVRDATRGLDGEIFFMIFRNGGVRYATAEEMERVDINPHPGYEHHAALCPNCGY